MTAKAQYLRRLRREVEKWAIDMAGMLARYRAIGGDVVVREGRIEIVPPKDGFLAEPYDGQPMVEREGE